jgi:hypothetical protein
MKRAYPLGIILLCGLSAACSASHQNDQGATQDNPSGSAGDAGSAGSAIAGSAGVSGSSGSAAGMAGAGSGGGGSSAGGSNAGGSNAGGSFGGSFAGGASGASGASAGDCDDETKGSIYILGQDRQFTRFQPETQTLTQLGTLNCPGEQGFSTTFSMAVDRQGFAWVLFQTGSVYKVDTKTVACTNPGFVPCQKGFCTFGMGFVSDMPGANEETLYVSGVYNGGSAQGLATINTTTLELTPISDYDLLAGKGAELTGTGDARLFGYFQDTPIRLAEIDKGNAHIISYSDLIEIPTGTSWAFAFWGGVFYIMSGTEIYKYDPTSQITTLINGNVGYNIVGAGVSTCAPTDIPE